MSSILGVDIGGTYTKFFNGKDYWKEKTPKSVEGILRLLKKHSENYETLGVALAGLIDTKKGVITESPNMKFLNNLPFRDLVEKELKKKVYLINDANAATLAEFKKGAGKGAEVFLFLALGTGLGGGAVIEGKLLEGFSGCAMEVGHIAVEIDGWPCHCGRKGCLEAYVSSYGLERFYKLLTNKCLSSKGIIELANKGDREALEAIEKLIEYLSAGITNLVHIFNPDKVALGGGIVAHFPKIVEKTEKLVKERAFKQPSRDLKIMKAKLGEFSGAVGAYLYAKGFLT